MKIFILLLLLQLFYVFSFGQLSLKGIILNEEKEPLIGASVVIQNTYYGMSTGTNGSFEFKNLKPGNYQLAVSYIGYETSEHNIELNSDTEIEIILVSSTILKDEILISATRAKDKTPVAYTDVSGLEIESKNMGQDIPYLLSLTPSFVATSDAGTGIGYTNFRIRGTDLNRINVTVNGIPLNDAESHGTWFVDMPDLASSTKNIQVQRGVGTSTNGAAAFGATINMQTTTLNKEAYAKYSSTAGSYNTFKNSVSAGTGLLNDHFTFDVRLSKVTSNGFIDRASSDLKSFFTSVAYYSENMIVKANVYSGFEETYQAWWGVPSVKLNNDFEGMQRYLDHWLWSASSERMNLIKYEELINSNARTYNYYTYDNAVDHYQQDHYELHLSHKIDQNLNVNAALFYTYGKGYYENYEYDQKYTDYQMVVSSSQETLTDLVGRKWLDNDFYGATYSLNYEEGKSTITLGGGYNVYDGRHFGQVIWAQYMGENEKGHEWYRGTGLKKDFNFYVKYNFQATEKLNLFADIQYRYIDYNITGIDDDLRNIAQSHFFNFFNPKFGIFYKPAMNQEMYLSYARANREPNRSNYTDADPNGPQPVYETLNDFEFGYNIRSSFYSLDIYLYYMDYNNQLILTGEINDVGAPIMVNVKNSYRSGIEILAGVRFANNFQWDINATFSRNKILDFTEYVDNWNFWDDPVNEPYQYANNIGTTDLAYSPEFVANSQLKYTPVKNFSISLSSNYVGTQYIDNTSDPERNIDGYFINNLAIDYSIKPSFMNEISFYAMANNLFDVQYESNAWVYSYYYGGKRYKMDGYFPQAGLHFMMGVDFKF